MIDEAQTPPAPTPPEPQRSKHPLPYSRIWPLVGGLLTGAALRLIFSGEPGEAYATMTASFILFSPLLVSIVTVYLAERQKRRSWAYYFWAPFLANALCVIGALLVLVEGLICAILIVPLFAAVGGIGGMAMGVVCRATNWPRQVLYSFAALPLLLGMLEKDLPLPERLGAVERSVLINAAPAEVWRHIENVRDIQPQEVERAWMYRIGVPLPVAGLTERTAEGLVRRISMGKDIYFDQVVKEWEPERRVMWTYRFYEDSFPPDALDDHVLIGGHYFDLRNTSYTLTPRGEATELTIRMEYRVSTQWNWYAAPVANVLIGNFAEVILDFYRQRGEARMTADLSSR